jgi:ribosomal-protein-alanine N-acetyltransferase
MSGIVDVVITALRAEQAAELSDLLLSAPAEYSKHFTPFAFDRLAVSKVLSQAQQDRYYGIIIAGKIAGFFMLRGFDQGYKVPAYGVWIAPQHTGKGLAELTLKYAVAVCRASSIDKLMLKVHPDNIVAKGIYERNGFAAAGTDEKNGNIIYHKTLIKA